MSARELVPNAAALRLLRKLGVDPDDPRTPEKFFTRDPDEQLCPKDAALWLGRGDITDETLGRWRQAAPPKGPAFTIIGGRVSYSIRDLIIYMVENLDAVRRRPAADEGTAGRMPAKKGGGHAAKNR